MKSEKPYCDFRYVNWWTRKFSSPICPRCDCKMKYIEYPYGILWQCGHCDWITFFKPKGAI